MCGRLPAAALLAPLAALAAATLAGRWSALGRPRGSRMAPPPPRCRGAQGPGERLPLRAAARALSRFAGALDAEGQAALTRGSEPECDCRLQGLRWDPAPGARIALAVVADERYAASMGPQAHALRCYAARHRYGVLRLVPAQWAARSALPYYCGSAPSRLPGGPEVAGNWWKPCLLAEALQCLLSGRLQGAVDWLFLLDADVASLGMAQPLEEYVAGPHAAIAHLERFQSGEVMSGTLAAAVSPLALSYLRGWAVLTEFYWRLRQTGNGLPAALQGLFGNSDNGALLLLLAFCLAELAQGAEAAAAADRAGAVVSALLRIRGDMPTALRWGAYERYIAATQLCFGPRRTYPPLLRLLRRGSGWLEDADLEYRIDPRGTPFIHGVKSWTEAQCEAGRNASCRPWFRRCSAAFWERCAPPVEACELRPAGRGPRAPRLRLGTAAEQRADYRGYRCARHGLGGANDVAACWPRCTADLDAAAWERKRAHLQRSVQCERPLWGCAC